MCDDGDRCTADQCVGGECAHQALEDVPAVTCRLDTLAADLQSAAADDLGGSGAQKKYVKQIGGVHRTVDAAGPPGNARARKKFKRAGRQLQAFINGVTRGQRRHKITVGLGDRLLKTANDAKGVILPFQKP